MNDVWTPKPIARYWDGNSPSSFWNSEVQGPVLQHNGLNAGCDINNIGVLVGVLAVPLPIFLLGKAPRKGTKAGSNTWSPGPMQESRLEFQAHGFGLGQAIAVTCIVNKYVNERFSLSFPHFLSNHCISFKPGQLKKVFLIGYQFSVYIWLRLTETSSCPSKLSTFPLPEWEQEAILNKETPHTMDVHLLGGSKVHIEQTKFRSCLVTLSVCLL